MTPNTRPTGLFTPSVYRETIWSSTDIGLLHRPSDQVVAGAVLNAKDLFEDPHIQERGMIATMDHPQRGEWKMIGNPINLSDSPTEYRAAPLLGQDTDEVLAGVLGYSEERIEKLRQESVV